MFVERFNYKITFIIVSLAMMVLCITCSTPIPFYSEYQSMFNISTSILSFSTVFYFAGNVTSLLFFSRVSNYVGRKITSIITLTLAIIGCLSFFIVNNDVLLFGRLLQGLSCGMSAGCLQTYILDTGLENSNIGIIISTNIPLIGFSIGSLTSGTIVECYPFMIRNIFLLLALMLIIFILLISLCKETVSYKKGVLTSLKPELKFPKNIRCFLPLACIILVSTYSITGFYQTFSSTMAFEFGFSSKIIAAIIYSSLIFPQLFGSTVMNRIGVKDAQYYGYIGFAVAMFLITFSLFNHMLLLFIISNIVASLFCGMCFTACMNNLMSRTSKTDRAGVLASIYVITDGGTAVVNLMVSVLLSFFTFYEIVLGYLLMVVVSLIFVVILIRRLNFDYSEF